MKEIIDDNKIVTDEVEFEGIKIKIFSPTDWVRDRLVENMRFKSRVNFDWVVL